MGFIHLYLFCICAYIVPTNAILMAFHLMVKLGEKVAVYTITQQLKRSIESFKENDCKVSHYFFCCDKSRESNDRERIKASPKEFRPDCA